jgi:hypothetical protein
MQKSAATEIKNSAFSAVDDPSTTSQSAFSAVDDSSTTSQSAFSAVDDSSTISQSAFSAVDDSSTSQSTPAIDDNKAPQNETEDTSAFSTNVKSPKKVE